jgi:hypothetical protein
MCCPICRSVLARYKDNEREESLKDKAQGVADKARGNLQQAAGKVGNKANVDNVSAVNGTCMYVSCCCHHPYQQLDCRS